MNNQIAKVFVSTQFIHYCVGDLVLVRILYEILKSFQIFKL